MDAAHLSKIQELVAFGGVKYGLFLSAVISFILVAFVLFLLIKGINRMNKPALDEPAKPTQEELLTQIRDLLKK